MSPNFSGFNYDDHNSFVKLNTITIALSLKYLQKDGTVVLKTLQGPTDKSLFVTNKALF
jgi:23S rRNA U2552 (ribose-2'-O)-methylase RlmE/FtsJ